jgi:hypothetical protein
MTDAAYEVEFVLREVELPPKGLEFVLKEVELPPKGLEFVLKEVEFVLR